MYQIFRILLPIFPSLARLRGGAGHPEPVRERSDARVAPAASSRRRPQPGAPRLHRAPGSETPRPIIPHIISLSQEQQIPINLRSKLFPILDQATSGCVGEGKANRPHPTPIWSSSSIPSQRSCDSPDSFSPPSPPPHPTLSSQRPGTPRRPAHKYPHPTLPGSRHPQRVRTGGP